MSTYSRELVELLVPTLWDRTFAWGMLAERPIDPLMPKAATPKNQAGTLWAHLADIRRAYDMCPTLTRDERAALLLIGGMGMTHRLAAWYEHCDRRATVTERYERGVGRLMDYLNGTDWSEEVTDLD